MVAMSKFLSKTLVCAGLLAIVSACNSGPKTTKAVLPEQLNALPLDINTVRVEESKEILEVAIDPAVSQLQHGDVDALERFFAGYRNRGHGQIEVAMPENSPNTAQASQLLGQIRGMAWEAGIAWSDIQGSAFDARGYEAPVLLSYTVYEAVAPECLSLAAYNLADVSNNNELGYFGCSVRNNIAAMLADPGDLLAQRSLGPRDARRVSLVMEAYRAGQPTAAQGGAESVSPSEE